MDETKREIELEPRVTTNKSSWKAKVRFAVEIGLSLGRGGLS